MTGRRRSTLAAFVAVIALPVVASVVPEIRLARQMAAARREGLWTSLDDLRLPHDSSRRKTALPFALARDLARRRRDFKKRGCLPGGWFQEKKALLAYASDLLATGRSREAARLAALILQEPTFVAVQIGSDIALRALAADPNVENELGPTPDFHALLRSKALDDLEEARLLSSDEGRRALGFKPENFSMLARLTHCRPVGASVEAGLLDGWRALMRELPQDPGDLAGAESVLDRRFPAIDRNVNGYFALFVPLHRDAKLLEPLIALRNGRRKALEAKKALYAGKR